jgi:hypothetical protein
VVEQVEYVSKLRNPSVGMLISSVYISKFFDLSFSCKRKHAKKNGKYVKDIRNMFSRLLFMVQFFARQTRPYPPNYKILREIFEEKRLLCDKDQQMHPFP